MNRLVLLVVLLLAVGLPACSKKNEVTAPPTPPTWQIVTVDAGGDVGMNTSLVLDRSGNPAISYSDVTNGIVKFAQRSGGSWTSRVMGIGSARSLALKYNGAYRFSAEHDDRLHTGG